MSEPTLALGAVDAALRYAAAGFRVLPLHTAHNGRCSCGAATCRSAGKHSRTEHGAHDASTDAATIHRWFAKWPDANLGMALPGLVVVDIDPRNGGDPGMLDHELPETCTAQTGGGGLHYVYRLANGARPPATLAPGIDIKSGPGAFICVEPSMHASGRGYYWRDDSEPWNLAPAQAPEWIAKPTEKSRPATGGENAAKKVREGGRNRTLASIAGSLRRRGLSEGALVAALLVENRAKCDPPLSEDEVRAIAQCIARYEPRAAPAPTVTDSPPKLEEAVEDALTNAATEDGIALAFALRHRHRLRFSHRHGRWFAWDGTRWREEFTALGFEYARQLSREVNVDGARTLAKASFAESVERFARSDRALAMRGDEWDAGPWLLGTPGGTVDLRTGELRPADPADLITRSTTVAPADAEPLVWREFLAQATEGDEEMELFLRQIAGYALAGVASEECLFFLYGPGGNGKGTFAGALHEILGEYAVAAAMDSFLASRFERHSTDLAMLAGARLVTASETRGGRSWDEQRVKALTGGDPITARFMRRDNFTFRPAFTLLLYGNHKPHLRNVDAAWRRRFHVVPFTHRPPARDITLKERLRAEYPAILRWAIDGCLDWQAHGLVVPARVQAETAGYLAAQDLFAAWLEERCERDPGRAKTLAALYGSWKLHAEAAGEHPGTARSFGDRLEQEGFPRVKDRAGIRGRGFTGLLLRP